MTFSVERLLIKLSTRQLLNLSCGAQWKDSMVLHSLPPLALLSLSLMKALQSEPGEEDLSTLHLLYLGTWSITFLHSPLILNTVA